jgi:hypothetical protein
MHRLVLLLLSLSVFGTPMSPFTSEVQYEVTGTIHYANLTRKNADGSTEQKQEKLPYSETFYARPGTPLYLSVQKARVTKVDNSRPGSPHVVVDDGEEGTVHVLIRVGGKVLQEAEASAPFGIATASGVVPE